MTVQNAPDQHAKTGAVERYHGTDAPVTIYVADALVDDTRARFTDIAAVWLAAVNASLAERVRDAESRTVARDSMVGASSGQWHRTLRDDATHRGSSLLADMHQIAPAEIEREPFNALMADAVQHFIVGGLLFEISDPGTRTLAQRFLSLLAHRRDSLDGSALARALAMLDDALPAEDDSSPEHHLGPFYTSEGLARRWGVSRQAIHRRKERRTLLALPASDNNDLYPAFQFINPDVPGRREVLPGLRAVWDALRDAHAEPLTVATWLRTADPRLGGRTAEEYLRDGDIDTVVSLAKSDAHRWMH